MKQPFLLASTALAISWVTVADSYERSIQQWRQEMEEELKSDAGWLTVAGLYWLAEGVNTVGAAENNRVVLPYGPARLGEIELSDGRAVFRYADSSQSAIELRPDTSGEPTKLKVGESTFWLIQRGDRSGIRLRDLNSKMRREFTHREWYAVKPAYRITARFDSYGEPRPFQVPSVLGIPEEMECPGELELVINGETVRIKPVLAEDSLWVIFRDQTSGRTTYGGGRFLYTELPEDGRVVVDFNKAYNPPCAFTPYATCPLPPKANRLSVAVEAGEKNYGERH